MIAVPPQHTLHLADAVVSIHTIYAFYLYCSGNYTSETLVGSEVSMFRCVKFGDGILEITGKHMEAAQTHNHSIKKEAETGKCSTTVDLIIK